MRVALHFGGYDAGFASGGIPCLRLPVATIAAMRLLILILVVVLTALQYRLWVGQGSLAEVHGLRKEIALQEDELVRLRARNRELQAEVMDLREGVEALEERARRDLGMIKPGEIFIQVIERKTPEKAAQEGQP